jgi:NAD(P)H-dependent FMN reductase
MSKIIVLVGSGTEKSRSLNLAQAVATALQGPNIEVEIIDLLHLQLPAYNVTTEANASYDQKTQEFLDKSKTADGWVWVTPVYHNSYSSILKNALDWQHFYFDHKVLGLASHAGPDRSPQAADHLLMVARAQHFVPVPTRVFTKNDDYDEEKQLTSDEIKQRIADFAKEFKTFLEKFKP